MPRSTAKTKSTAKKTAGTSAKTTAKDIRAKVLEYISRQKNNTFNYRQVAYAIDEDTPAAHRTIICFLNEMWVHSPPLGAQANFNRIEKHDTM